MSLLLRLLCRVGNNIHVKLVRDSNPVFLITVSWKVRKPKRCSSIVSLLLLLLLLRGVLRVSFQNDHGRRLSLSLERPLRLLRVSI